MMTDVLANVTVVYHRNQAGVPMSEQGAYLSAKQNAKAADKLQLCG
jgi:hypothetical protein